MSTKKELRNMDIFNIDQQQVLDTISRHCPEALSTYLHCINRVTKYNTIFFSKELVEVEMSENWRPFRQNLKKLARENLLEWQPFNDGIAVTLADLNDHG